VPKALYDFSRLGQDHRPASYRSVLGLGSSEVGFIRFWDDAGFKGHGLTAARLDLGPARALRRRPGALEDLRAFALTITGTGDAATRLRCYGIGTDRGASRT